MVQDLLLEIGTEEIPSAYLPNMIKELQQRASEGLDEVRLSYEQVSVYATPRRLVLRVNGLAEKQSDALIETRGPKKDIAMDENGKPTKAGLGFARSQGIEFEYLFLKEFGGIEYIYAIKKQGGRGAAEIMPEVLTKLMLSLPFPKTMRWGYFNTRFPRPIRWILALLGSEVLGMEIENIVASNLTYGHRFLAPSPVTINNVEHYFEVMENNHVILDQEKRKELIWRQIVAAAGEQGGTPMENPDLLEEITYLVEYPTAFYGTFDQAYLQVPPEVLTTTMIKNQRYFPVFDQNRRLMPGFIGVRNGTDYCLDKVRSGNEGVLRARLEDALFFWNEDINKPLAGMAAGLNKVLFHEQLGTLQDKGERMAAIALHIGAALQLSTPEKINAAALLCKADLLSGMVYEFPELQGIMGRYYALKENMDPDVAQAIFEHYLPRFAGDLLPQNPTGIILSLAEKAYNLTACFALNIKPTGSQDPYALRRQALGLINIILKHHLTLPLSELFATAYDSLQEVQRKLTEEETIVELQEFVCQRLRGILLEKGLSYDVIDAVLAVNEVDLNDICRRVEIIQDFKTRSEFEDFMVAFNRAYNLSKKWEENTPELSVLTDESEIRLWQLTEQTQEQVQILLAAAEYLPVLNSLSALRPSIDDFFQAVMVMTEDEKVKAARLSILKAITDMCMLVADFSKIIV